MNTFVSLGNTHMDSVMKLIFVNISLSGNYSIFSTSAALNMQVCDLAGF